MNVATAHVLRSLRAESIRTAGRGPLWMVLVPAATLVPVGITVLIAYVAERFAAIPGQQYVQQVTTSNAAYWVVSITVVLCTVAAAYGQAYEYRHGTMEYVARALPRNWTVLAGKWLLYGVVGAATAALTVASVLVVLPLVSPVVYGAVSISDPVATRLLWTVPLFAFFAAGFGVGVGSVIRSPAGAVGAILFWVYVIEPSVGLLPGGSTAQRVMPFLNGVYATGQDIVLDPPWGPNAALLYTAGIFTVILGCGLAPTAVKGSNR